MPCLESSDRHRRKQRHRVLALLLAATAAGVAGAASPSWQVADLKSWLHGEPAPPAKAAPPAQRAVVSRAAGLAEEPAIEDFLRALAAALMARDGRAMAPRLSSRYTVDDLPSGAKASDFFAQAVDQMPGPREMVLMSVAAESGLRVARVEFHHSNDRVSTRTFRFDVDGRLVSSDLFRLKRQGFGA